MAKEQIDLSNGSIISVRSSGQGNAGNIFIQAGDTFRSRNSSVTAEAQRSDGGNIDLRAGRMVHLTDSRITTAVGTSQDAGGNISIDPESVTLNRSQIRADAFGGPGGNINIVAGVFLPSNSLVSASSALSTPGTIAIEATFTDVTGTLPNCRKRRSRPRNFCGHRAPQDSEAAKPAVWS